MATASRIGLYKREVIEHLGRSALEVILARMDCLSEGQREKRGGRELWLGSTMLTVDLAALADVVYETLDAGTARRVAELLAEDGGAAAALKARAVGEAARLSGAAAHQVSAELRVRAQGTKVFVDVDVEVAL